MTVDISANEYIFRTTSSKIAFKGYTAVYSDMAAEEEQVADTLPDLSENEKLEFSGIYTVNINKKTNFDNEDTAKRFFATKEFDKSILVNGAVLWVKSGWQYRPERWKSNAVQSGLPEPTTQEIFYVTEEFWEGYEYRAFNISVIGSNQSIKNDPTAVTHFNIYVPKGTSVPDIKVEFPKAPTADDFDPADYTLLEFEYTMGGYWNSGDTNNHHKIITNADNSGYFIATEMFTKETLPVGAVIVIDEGWQYRPEAWKDENRQTSRPGNVTTNIVFVTEAWWGSYTHRAFNIAVEGNNVGIRDNPDAITHFRIYIPKS